MIVDVHTHVGESKFIEDLLTVERALRVMDESAIDKAFFCQPYPPADR